MKTSEVRRCGDASPSHFTNDRQGVSPRVKARLVFITRFQPLYGMLLPFSRRVPSLTWVQVSPLLLVTTLVGCLYRHIFILLF